MRLQIVPTKHTKCKFFPSVLSGSQNTFPILTKLRAYYDRCSTKRRHHFLTFYRRGSGDYSVGTYPSDCDDFANVHYERVSDSGEYYYAWSAVAI